MRRVRVQVVVAALVSVVTAGCGKTPQQFVASGDQFLKEGKYAEAAIEYSNALHKDAQFAQARYKLAETYMAEGNTRAAFPEYIRAADLMPENTEVQLKAGYLLLKGGLFTEAKERARTVLQRNPNNLSALLLLGNTLAGMQNLDEALSVLSKAVVIDPERAGTYTNMAILQLAQGDRDKALETFLKAVDVSHGSPDAYVALGQFYAAAERKADAEEAFKNAVAANPNHVGARQALAALYLDSGRSADAEPHLKAITSFSNNAEATAALAGYYTSVGRNDDAIKTLEPLAADKKLFAEVKTRIALIIFSEGKRPEAQALLDEVLAREPRNAATLAMKARLLLADGRPDEALAVVKEAILANNKLSEASLTLGRIQLALNDVDAAKQAFKDVLATSPNSLAALLELSDLHRQRRELDTALQFADQAIRAFPGNLKARLTRVRVLLIRPEDRTRAFTELKALVTKYGNEASLQSALGQYYMAENNVAEARQAFQRALASKPDHMEALTGLVALDLSAKNLADALARVNAALAMAPDSAGFLILQAQVYQLAGDFPKAQDALMHAIKVDAANPTPYSLLAEIMLARGQVDDAKKQFAEVARLQPHSVGAPTMLGVLYYATGDRESAANWWDKALKIDPKAPAANNNRAWLYAEANEKLDLARDMAMAARAKMPDEPEFNDTLGWVFYKKHESRQAIRYLLLATDVDGKNPQYQFHLGMAYAQAGEDARAGRALKAALAGAPNAHWAADAKKTLALLVY